MKKLNKKGFTIVELVIVIAVIAILAAVLIPTYSSVVEKAKTSKALQAARNTYTEYIADLDYTKEQPGDYYVVKVSSNEFVAVVKGEVAETISASADAAATAFKDKGYVVLERSSTDSQTITTSAVASSSSEG